MDRPLYYDTQGRVISVHQWGKLLGERVSSDSRWWRVAETEVGDVKVSTVWLGLDHGYGAAPLIFESMAFGCEEKCERYSTWREAEEGHWRMVAEVEGENAAKIAARFPI